MSRHEFDARTKLAITKRATVDGVTRCEECHCAVSRWEIHHLKEDALETDKRAKLTPAQGALLCVPCHKEHTRAFIPVIAKIKRVEQKHMGARRTPTIRSRDFPPAAPKDRTVTKRANGVNELAWRFAARDD